MRDEVFRVRSGPELGKQRSVFIEDEPHWLMLDVVRSRGYDRATKAGPRTVALQVSADNRELVWILEPGSLRPKALWVVSAAGRSELHDLYPQRQQRKRRTSPRGKTGPMPGFLPRLTTEES